MSRRRYEGIVISDKMQKTIIVRVVTLSRHAKYGRTVKICNKFKVHDEKNQAKKGDRVRIEETRPLSKDKRFRLVEIIEKAVLLQARIKEDIQ
jgi:small subunit ribosomal protein S17